jgi:hypothetical protein
MLTDEELRALIAELDAIVTNDPYPLSPRIQMLRAFLVKFGEMDGLPPELAEKLRPTPPASPLPKVYAPPSKGRWLPPLRLETCRPTSSQTSPTSFEQ